MLFSESFLSRPRRELSPGAYWVPDWLSAEEQRWIVARFHEWGAGPVPPRAAKIGDHEMSVQSLCLGWHWRPYEYSREATDVNGNRVLDFPDWMVRLGRKAIFAATRDQVAAERYTPDAALVNYYGTDAKMGMHQDRDEHLGDPVVSLSIGDTCKFRFGNTQHRNQPYEDIALASGDLFVFGGPARLAFHGVTKILPGTAPEDCGLGAGRINITMRVTGLSD
ncbi:alpha-ketoglutarate-dependent dioxygenase AlkB [Paeniglutamicibacter sp. Y32M11]|uniref:alpha-ketoglutarate-dependent dioxygenase AlkB family protein n=1 Tax=Paeniglutamicibacter sp. Y32M11 TaxID=2853258 RepID=UPI001C52A7DE|nr:alpha-ketoglutarate-dependent dioxygenase AlkB [Paeniglutamicibacter sp. Y32M11]QXQ12251.1 alpha-ketoglutarate-dependent dioxygenase AlkB [Paeniglutamicibacter sp. Y32M11]